MKKSAKSPILGSFNFANRFLIGLVLALSITLSAFEYTTVSYENKTFPEDPRVFDDDLILPPITYRLEKIEKPKIIKTPSPSFVVVKNTDPIEPEKEPDPEPNTPKEVEPFDPSLYGQVKEVIIEDEVPYYSAEFFAHYDLCAGLSSDEMYQCSLQDIINRIQKNFEVPRRLKDESGDYLTYMSFMVSKTGEISDIKVERSNHPLMGKAATKAIEKLPPMNPAKQKGKAVNLILRVPIRLEIQ